MRHELPSGGWVDILGPADLKGLHRDRFEVAVRHQIPLSDAGDLDLARMLADRVSMDELRRNAALAVAVTAWSYTGADGEPLPVPAWDGHQLTGADSIGDYPLGDTDVIDALAADLVAKLRRPDPKAATTSASNGGSKASARNSPKA